MCVCLNTGAAALARAVAAWRAAPTAGRLSERVVAGIIRRAREAAAAAFPASRTRAIGSPANAATPTGDAGAPGLLCCSLFLQCWCTDS